MDSIREFLDSLDPVVRGILVPIIILLTISSIFNLFACIRLHFPTSWFRAVHMTKRLCCIQTFTQLHEEGDEEMGALGSGVNQPPSPVVSSAAHTPRHSISSDDEPDASAQLEGGVARELVLTTGDGQDIQGEQTFGTSPPPPVDSELSTVVFPSPPSRKSKNGTVAAVAANESPTLSRPELKETWDENRTTQSPNQSSKAEQEDDNANVHAAAGNDGVINA